MRRIFLFLNMILLAGICLAQESTERSQEEADRQGREQNDQAEATGRNPALDNAPAAVKEQVMRHATDQDLKELDVLEWEGANIYEAVFEGKHSETRLRLGENGAPVSMHIVGRGGPAIEEAAGARRDNSPEPQLQQPAAAALQQPVVSSEVRDRIQQQLGETQLLEIQPKIFYQLNIRQNGEVQQIWADENGTVLREQQ